MQVRLHFVRVGILYNMYIIHAGYYNERGRIYIKAKKYVSFQRIT